MVIFCAVGGRFSIFGAVYGVLLVNAAKTVFSEAYPELWLFAMGLIFVGVVLAFQDGLAGFYKKSIEPRLKQMWSSVA
jgi:urea transport system permease protein